MTGGELFDEIVAREYYSENDARCVKEDTRQGGVIFRGGGGGVSV